MVEQHGNLKRQQAALASRTELGPGQEHHFRMYWDSTSPYSNKIRAFMNYRQIPHVLIQTTLEDYTQALPELVGMPIIPVLLAPDGRVMQDSTPILEWFEREVPQRSTVPDDAALAWLMWLLEEFADEYLLRLCMRTRWGTEDSKKAMSARIARNFARGHPSEVMRGVAQFILGRQTEFDTILAIGSEADRASADAQLLQLLGILDRHLEDHGYLLGERPSIADFGFFGMLWAMTLNDACSGVIIETAAPQLCNWLEEIAAFGDPRGCLGRTDFGPWLSPGDELPATLLELVGFIASTYLPQALGYREAMLQDKTEFTATIYDVPTTMPRWDYRAGTFAVLQQRYSDLAEPQRDWLQSRLAGTGLLPELMLDGIHPNPHFAALTPPFVTDPGLNRRAYERAGPGPGGD